MRTIKQQLGKGHITWISRTLKTFVDIKGQKDIIHSWKVGRTSYVVGHLGKFPEGCSICYEHRNIGRISKELHWEPKEGVVESIVDGMMRNPKWWENEICV